MSLNYLASLLQLIPWEHHFDERTQERGQRYADQGRVDQLEASLNADDDSILVLAGIHGSGNQRYQCRLTLTLDDGELDVYSNCSCPVGYLCKHAAATLYTVSDNVPADSAEASPELTGPPDWSRWLERMNQPVAEAIAEPERRLGILLADTHADDQAAPHQLMAQIAWMRPSRTKSGKTSRPRWVDPQPLHEDLAQNIEPRPQAGWPEDVEVALALLLQAPTSWGRRAWPVIQARHHETALETLLEHYPAWFERGGTQPLQRGPALKPQWQWTRLDDGSQQLVMQLADGREPLHVLRGHHLWYVDEAARQFGRIEGNANLVESLRHAPPLAPDQVEHALTDWNRHALTRDLPMPATTGPAQPINAKPSLVLSMRQMNLLPAGRGKTCTIGVAHVGFDFDGLRICFEDIEQQGDTIQRWHGNRMHTITPDIPELESLLDPLDELGVTHYMELPVTAVAMADGAWQPDDHVLLSTKQRKPASPEAWQPVLKALAAQGCIIEYSDDFPRQEAVDVDDWYGALEPSGNHWFDVSLGIEVDGEKKDLMPILRRLIADPAFPRQPAKGEKKHATWRVPLDETRYAELPLQRLRQFIEPLLEWLETEPDGEPRIHRSRADELDAMPVPWQGGEALGKHLAALRQARQPARPPRGLKATLRPYQCDGLAWLNFLGRTGLGGILADDMGLGKTVQVLAHILAEKQARRLPRPALVVAPTSLVGNWASEAARFAPRLKVLILHGPDRHDHFEAIEHHDLVITTYPLLPRDSNKLAEHPFSLLVLDEAQAIKNAHSQAAQTVRELDATRRLAMTGTPLENHLGELWAQLDAVEPGLLGSERHFKRHYRTPIEKHADAERQHELNRRIGSLILRRRKEDVLTDLPAKTEIVRTLELAGPQRELYETLRLAQHERVREAINQRGLAQAGIVVLDALLKLRQACCDPHLVKLESARKVRASAKLEALLELVEGLVAEGRRVLVFSQFTAMLALVEAALEKRKIAFETLTGQTPAKQRSVRVARFQEGQTPLFLISLKAGGTGLNLTAADTVIHYDPWWNPAVEAQATDRAHRIGQDKPVFVYRLICAGTVEEKIQAMQAQKADLAKAVLEGGASKKLRFDEADLEALLGPS